MNYFVAGAKTLLGRAVLEALRRRGDQAAGDQETGVDLLSAESVNRFFIQHAPEHVIFAGTFWGGLLATKQYPADLMLENLSAQCHLFRAAHQYKVKKMVFMARSCMFPRETVQPMRVEALMTGALEPSCGSYALANLAGAEMVKAYRKQYSAPFICVIPSDVFGPGEDFDPKHSHVIPALIRKFHEAQARHASEVVLWGTGRPMRDFLYSEDMASACLWAADHYDGDAPLNLSAEQPHTIAEIAQKIQKITGFTGKIVYDSSYPDGTPAKILDASAIRRLGWRPKISLEEGLRRTYEDFLNRYVKTESAQTV